LVVFDGGEFVASFFLSVITKKVHDYPAASMKNRTKSILKAWPLPSLYLIFPKRGIWAEAESA
jgi:hypothetical protein